MENNSDKARRQKVADRIRVQAVMCDYGLPESGGFAPQNIRAIRELDVRLNLFVATGESSKGWIDFPEAKREIHYNFNGRVPENSTVRFKALVKR